MQQQENKMKMTHPCYLPGFTLHFPVIGIPLKPNFKWF
jgi:hypothetical protein